MFIMFIRSFFGVALLFLATQVFAQPKSIEPLIDPDYRPKLSSDEGGFWYQIDQLEEKIKNSSYVVKDESLNRYINDLVCRLADEYCNSIRVYIIDNPHFNASMYPNGMMHIWTGLLLRIENEAQLASVLAHEIAHYLRIHQITQWRKLRSGLAFTTMLDVMLTGGLATLALAGNTASFSRVQEKEADIYGVQLMVANNYDPNASWKLWEYLTHEREVDESKSKRGSFFASHPHSEDRSAYLQKLSKHYGHVDSRV